MKETSIYTYYAFGYNYSTIRSDWEGIAVALGITRLESYLGYVTDLQLPVTTHVTMPLNECLKTLRTLKPTDGVPEALAQEIKKLINDADKTLDAELEIKKVLSVTPKRFDLEMLLKHPEKLLAEHCWAVLSATSKKDFSDATRCIAMNLSTAAAFHLMRCVEEGVRQLYFEFVKNGRMARPLWAPMVDKLKSKNNPKPSAALLAHLDIIRTNYRNPTQHPDKFYGSDEAQDLLNASIVALSGICKEIAANRQP